MRSGFKFMVCALLLSTNLGGCGYRGNIEYPPEAKAESPNTGASPAANDPNAPKPPVAKSFKPFVLDSLIR